MVADRRSAPAGTSHRAVLLLALFLIDMAGCGQSGHPASSQKPSGTLTVGFGLTTSQSSPSGSVQGGIQQFARNIVLERLVNVGRDGRSQPGLFERWSTSPDGLTWGFHLRPGVTFHDGTHVTAAIVRDLLETQLPDFMGPAIKDVVQIRAVSETQLEFSLKERSAFVLEGLEVPVEKPGPSPIGTGAFSVTNVQGDRNQVEIRANEHYYGGKPFIDRIVIKPYRSVRSAWADMLRGDVDMLYEVGVDALDSLQPSSGTKVFTYERPYAYVAILNVQKPYLRDPGFRRELNAAIDRATLVRDVLKGHGTPAAGPVWPNHWAYSTELPSFHYEPRPVKSGRQLTFLYADASLERLALEVQRQLGAVGIDLDLKLTTLDQFYQRTQAGDFDAALADVRSGPNLLRPYQFWHSGSPQNWGHFSSRAVDAALDTIRHAPDDAAYKGGVAAFQRAIIDDPPAIFLAWSERARAVSTRFEVPIEPGRDVLSTLRLWRPVGDRRQASRN
jgi:peptide/nickel transport system substrate-binding protein